MLCAKALGVDFKSTPSSNNEQPWQEQGVTGPAISELAKQVEDLAPRDMFGNTQKASREFLKLMSQAGEGEDGSE